MVAWAGRVPADYSFNATPRAWLLFVAAAALFVALGFWQLRRAEEKVQLNLMRESRTQEPPIRFDATAPETLGDFRYRPVSLDGTFDVEHQFLVDNQLQGQRVGYHVLTPLRIRGGGQAILVNRGWVPLGSDRRDLPAIELSRSGPVRLHGVLDELHRVGFRLQGAEIPAPGWPSLVQVPDVARLSERLGYSLLPYQVLLAPEAAEGYVREWHTARLDPGKNRGYALQWFSFAAVAAFLFIRHGLTSGARRPSQS